MCLLPLSVITINIYYMIRILIYGAIGGIVAPLVLSVILTLLPSSLIARLDQLGLLLISGSCVLGFSAGAWLGNSLKKRFERKPLTKDEDERMARAFVLVLISLSLVVTLIHFYDCDIAHLNLPECGAN